MKRRARSRKERRRDEVAFLARRASDVVAGWEKYGIAEYAKFFSQPSRVIWVNLVGGIARGFGIAIGFTLVTAVFLSVLARLARLNLPVIGQFVAELTRIVQHELNFSR